MALCVFAVPAQASEISISSGAAVLMDLDSGRVLFGKNADLRLPPGGLTKNMTGLLAAERIDLDFVVELPSTFVPVTGGGAGLNPRDKRTVEALLYATLLHSSNNAAQALAIGVSGSEKSFESLMNQRSAELGMTNTTWRNVHGLHEEGQLTTAYDMALLTRAAMQNPIYAGIVKTEYVTDVPWGEGKTETFSHNDITFLRSHREVNNGVRTGYTSQSGYCIAASATRGGITLVAVIMDAGSRQTAYDEVIDLLNYGFENYSRVKAGSQGEKLGTVKVSGARNQTVDAVLAEDVHIPLHKSNDKPVKSVSLPEKLEAPVAKGDVIGSVTFADGDFEITVELLAAENVKRRVFWDIFRQAFKRIFSVWVK